MDTEVAEVQLVLDLHHTVEKHACHLYSFTDIEVHSSQGVLVLQTGRFWIKRRGVKCHFFIFSSVASSMLRMCSVEKSSHVLKMGVMDVLCGGMVVCVADNLLDWSVLFLHN